LKRIFVRDLLRGRADNDNRHTDPSFFPFFPLPKMNCGSGIGSSGSSGKCAFATEKLALLEARVGGWGRMKAATEKTVREGKLEIHIAHQDLALLEKKIRDATGTMGALRLCISGR
jgi:hypothetical protein